jgi:magnesium-transporting ATPase (P-type)
LGRGHCFSYRNSYHRPRWVPERPAREEQFSALDEKRDHVVKVIRDDKEQMIDIRNVGDIVLFEPGEVIPCDDVFLSCHNVWYDGSDVTGESSAIKKLPPDGVQLLDSEGVAGLFPFKRTTADWPSQVEYDDLATDPALIGTTGIEVSLRDGVREAVVRVTLCTGDIAFIARSIAQQCGIYTSDGIIMEEPHLLSLLPDVLKSVSPRSQAPARSLPEDKRMLVEALKERGNFVCITGDGTEDEPALKAAHVGFFMSISGTEIGNEAMNTILTDDNFSSIVRVIMWGQCVNDAVRKILQFQIITNVTAMVMTFITVLASSEEEGPLSAAQLLWPNIIDTFVVFFALATDPASPVLLNREPDKKTVPSFTVYMLKQIAGQSTYQNAIVLIFTLFGPSFFGFRHSDEPSPQKHNNAVVYNAFAFTQIFDPFDSRRLDRKLNIFEGTLKNWYFMAITSVGLSVFSGSASCLSSSNRVCCPNHNLPLWLRVSGHPYERERTGYLARTFLHRAFFTARPYTPSPVSLTSGSFRNHGCDRNCLRFFRMPSPISPSP